MTYRGRSYHSWLLGGAAAAAMMQAGAAAAQDTQFNIAPQPLASALNEFSVQSRQSVLFTTDLAQSKTSPGVNGEIEVADALSSVLGGTGLTWRRQGDTFLVVRADADPQSGSAAGDGADSGTVEALIVTAQKREEDIQDVPIAISAFTQETLERSQVAGGPDLMTQVPNMTFTKTNFTGYSIQLRGIGTQAISATTDAAVAVSFNNTSFIRNRFFEQEFYDLQRVEVLRGPQGTLYGRNATAGVVNLISQKPKFAYEAKVVADIANYSSTRLEGMVNVPLVEDKVALRLAGAWTKREGYSTNDITGAPIDGRDLWSSRLSLRFAPTDALDVNLIWEHFEEDDDRLRSGKQLCRRDARATVGPADDPTTIEFATNAANNYLSQSCLSASMYSPDAYQAPNGYSLPYYYPLKDAGLPIPAGFDPYASLTQSRDLRAIESTVDPKYTAKNDLVELQWTYDLTDDLTLSSETAYLYDTIYSMEDYNRFNTRSGAFNGQAWTNFRDDILNLNDAGNWEFCDPQIGCADRVVALDVSSAKSSQFSQEFRLSSDFDGPLNFSAGLNYLRYDTEDKYYVFVNTLTMMSAVNLFGIQGLDSTGHLGPWDPNGSNGLECMSHGQPLPNTSTYARLAGCMYIDPNPLSSVNDLGHNYFLSRNPYKLISYAAFGELYWNIADDLKLTAGLRVTRDQKRAPRIPSWLIAASSVGLAVEGTEEQEWTEPTGRLALDWKPDLAFTDETLLYASYSHGYKAGGANPPRAGTVIWGTIEGPTAVAITNQSASKPRTFDAEFVDAFEIGSKNTLADGRVTLNLAAFYYDYTGYQISQIIDRSAVNYNFDAKIWGVELEADWRPLDNLRFGLKAGYEHTEIADGEQAIDIMDRTAGHDDWVVVRPFPTFSSNCILPLNVLDPDDDGHIAANIAASDGKGLCETAYALQMDPVTGQVYPNTDAPTEAPDPNLPNYLGFNPKHEYGNNNGEGFFKQLGGNELPNAPHFTGTLTADYTVPLPSDWLMTLHTDLYYQSEAWTRVFNTPGYDKLKAYTNVNVAAIFTNEDAGWKVMAYVKNVFDRDSITGAFLNSDDTGLTTNVFLTEPRLYGLRVTKEFDGGPWWTGATGKGPYPLWVELGGTVIRQDAPYETLRSDAFDIFPDNLDPAIAQNRDLDWGDQRQVSVTYKPSADGFSFRAQGRWGKANNGTTRVHMAQETEPRCPFGAGLGFLCDNPAYGLLNSGESWSDSSAQQREEHLFADFDVGKDFGLGASFARSEIRFGLRYGQFKSRTNAFLDGKPNVYLPEAFLYYDATYDRRRSIIQAEREFEGFGPKLSWEAAQNLIGNEEAGHLGLDWTVSGGVLFGRQDTTIAEQSGEFHFEGQYRGFRSEILRDIINDIPLTSTTKARSDDVTVPFVDLSLGLSYEIQRVKIGAGYRWERYFDVLDAGYAEHKDADRTIDGPYFKLAIGFGG